jgi:hypothetical protein
VNGLAFADWMALIQAITVVAGVGFAVLTVRNSAASQRQDLILEAEGQVDEARRGLLAEDSATLREIWGASAPFDGPQLKAYEFFYQLYGALSRLHYLLMDRRADVGMSWQEREYLASLWVKSLRPYAASPVFRALHANVRESAEFNKAFTDAVERELQQVAP